MLFCGPPGCGKTLCAEIFAAELGLPLYVVKLDRLISSYLGETAANVRKIFEFARKQPSVLFFDEFDAIARARDEDGEHNELRRVVNSLLIFIDRIQPKGFLVAATNLDHSIDPAIWRRFDEVVWFDKPDKRMIARFLKMKFKNVAIAFDPDAHLDALKGRSYAELERICVQAMKGAIIDRRKEVGERDFAAAVADEATKNSSAKTRSSWMAAVGIGAQYGILLPFSRSHESEADYLGLLFMARSGFNPEAAPAFWSRFGKAGSKTPEFLSTHPSDSTRVKQLQGWLAEAKAQMPKKP
jgi:SpoVK/Ycf46/Vps4 family AAA+-type ATPase